MKAMRDAMVICIDQMNRAICHPDYGDNAMYLVGCMKHCIEHRKKALATPPRNSDTGTVAEQEKRFHDTGELYHIPTLEKVFEWMQMPYEEGDVK